jgi:hypothetical protein
MKPSPFRAVSPIAVISLAMALSASGIDVAAQALPSGGGEPGAAYLACQVHVQKQSRDGLLACVSGERAEELEAMTDAEAKAMLEFAKMLQPTDIKVTGGSITGDSATLNTEAQQDGEKFSGTITMVKEGGVWKIQQENWTSGS